MRTPDRSGFSLVELLIVIAIIILLLIFGLPAYSSWRIKSQAEGEITKLHADLQYARKRAYSEKVECGLWWGANTSFNYYEIRCDGDPPTTAPDGDINDPEDRIMSSKALKIPISHNNTTLPSVTFNGRGFSNSLMSFHIDRSTGAATDCVDVSWTRIIVGRIESGSCIPR